MNKDIPIIFSAPMIRALLEGRKTMTRRLALTSRKLMEETKPGRYRSKTKIMDSPWKQRQLANFAPMEIDAPDDLEFTLEAAE